MFSYIVHADIRIKQLQVCNGVSVIWRGLSSTSLVIKSSPQDLDTGPREHPTQSSVVESSKGLQHNTTVLSKMDPLNLPVRSS